MSQPDVNVASERASDASTNTTSQQHTPQKRKRGERSANKAEGIYKVTGLDSRRGTGGTRWCSCQMEKPLRCGGQGTMQHHLAEMGFCAIRAQRGNVPAVKSHIHFRPEHMEKARKASMLTFSSIFRDFKSKLNCDFVKKGLSPFSKYGQISEQDWRIFVEQKTSSEAKELSDKMTELNKKNIYKPHLGPGGYKHKIPEWRAKEEKDRAEGKPDPLAHVEERARNWIRARSKITDEGEIVVTDPASQEVVQQLTGPISSQTQSEYHRDQLTRAVGTPEHGGRVRGVSSTASFKEGFPTSSSTHYRKHIFHKKDLEAQLRDQFKKQMDNYLSDLNISPSQFAAMASIPTSTHASTPVGASSDSMIAEADVITEDCPCELHVPFGYKGKTRKVATGIVHPGRTIHNMEVPSGYVRVSVQQVVPGHEEDELEFPPPDESIQTLHDAVGTFIIWKRSDIRMSTPQPSPTPLSGHGSFHVSQPAEGQSGNPSPLSGAASAAQQHVADDAVLSPIHPDAEEAVVHAIVRSNEDEPEIEKAEFI